MRRVSAVVAGLAAGLAVLATGCGTTLQAGQTSTVGTANGLAVSQSPGGSGGSGSGALISGASGGSGPTASTGGAGLSVGSTNGGGAPGAGPGGAPVRSAQSAGTSPRNPQQNGDGPGVTATTVTYGGLYEPDAAAADSALGVANANPGDLKAEQQAVIDYVNTHGGIAGRKVRPIWYEVSVQNTAQVSYQQACSKWTQDNKTFLMTSGDPTLDACVQRAGAIGMASGTIAAESTATLRQYPTDINVNGLTIDGSMQATINGLAGQGYFSHGKLGIATWDAPDFTWGIQHAVLPSLASRGIRTPPIAYITPPQSYGDLGATSASVSNAVLKFRSEGIDHVVLLDGTVGVNQSAILVLEWMNAAQSQRYYPTYGLNSTSAFSTGAADYPAKEMVGSVGVGWEPWIDLAQSDYGPSHYSANTKLCLQIMAKAGQTASNNNARGGQIAICEYFFFLQRALASVRGPLNQATALSAINAMGTRYQSMATFGIDITAQHHQGVELVRNVAFVPGCTCYRYTSGPYDPFR